MLQGHRQAELASAVVPNPFFAPSHAIDAGNPTEVVVRINLRESAVVSLAHKGTLEPHQIAAADRFRRFHEILSLGNLRSPSLDRQPVGQSDGFTDRHAIAGRELRRAREVLGRRGYALVAIVAGEGRGLGEFCRNKRERTVCADVLKALLSDLAALWGAS